MEKVFALIGVIISIITLALIFLIYSSFSWGFVCYKLYNWFVLTEINNMPYFQWWQFVGFHLFVVSISYKGKFQIKDEYLQDKSTRYIGAIILPWTMLFLCYIIHGMLY